MLDAKSVLQSDGAPNEPGEAASWWQRLFQTNNRQAPTFGQRLRLLRKARGLTQVQFGQRTCLSPTAVAELELGVQLPAARDLRAIASELGVPIERLLEGRIEP